MIESARHRRRREKALDWLAEALDVDRVQLALLLTDIDGHYRPYDKITAGKKPRRIDNPDDPLKSVQRRMLFRFLKNRAYDEILHGSIPGRSPLTNAGQHLGQTCVVRLDIAAFFPHVTVERVYDVWTRQLGLTPERARFLTRFSTFKGHLPQGAPTSSYLANLALAAVDARVKAEAAARGVRITRFVDDIVFSGARARELMPIVISCLRCSGFKVNRPKMKNAVANAASRQVVTGSLVNRQLGLPREERSAIRGAAYRLGLDTAAGRASAEQRASVAGRLAHLSRTNPAAAKRSRQLLDTVPHGKTH